MNLTALSNPSFLALAGALVLTSFAPLGQEESTLPRVIFLTHSAGFVHGVVKREAPEKLSLAERCLVEAAKGRFEVVPTQDCEVITPEGLKDCAAVIFYTTGELPIPDPQFLIDWVSNGGAFVGVHSATDTFYKFPAYLDMVGGTFDGHPWHEEVRLVVEDREHPATAHLGEAWTLTDEIYAHRDFRRFPLRGLLHLDGEKTDLSKGKREDGDYVNAWCKPFGSGRVFYTGLGHDAALWKDAKFLEHLLGGVSWAISGPDWPALAPEGAKVLMKPGDASAWRHADGRACEWDEADGVFTVKRGTGNLFTRDSFGDAFIHVEFSPSVHPPEVTGQARGNSGVYVQGRYELQILDSFGLEPQMGDCGACYGIALPSCTPYREAGRWSSYDIEFTAPRFDADGKKTASARLTAWLNGRKIHDDLEVPRATTAAWRTDEEPTAPLMLQDHGCPVRYRNVWVLPR